MFDAHGLPEAIAGKIEGLPWRKDDIGMSGSCILLFDEMVLKIERVSSSAINERKLLSWLAGKLPVPEMILAETKDGYSFLLMTRLRGEMACSDNSLREIGQTVKGLAAALRMLWGIDISGCPCTNGVAEKLMQARFNLENGLVDTDDFDPETFTCEGFEDTDGLYRYLEENRPAEDFVFSHGDLCLPNVFVSGANVTGFLDWGNGGIADRWQDIALCLRSLRSNMLAYGVYGQEEYERCKSAFFAELGMEPDEEKMRYYRLMDEFF